MSFDQFLTSVGLSNFVVEDFFLVQVGVLATTAFLLLVALVFVILTFKAARGAKRAEAEAEQHFATVQNLVVEMRDLHQKSERQVEDFKLAAEESHTLPERDSEPVRVSASETTPEAEIEVVSSNAVDEDPNSAEANEKDLASARDAASIPSALLGNLLRRNKR